MREEGRWCVLGAVRHLTFYLLSLGGNQRELARQKNMKKQSDSVKGKRRDDGLSAAARKQR